VWRPISLLVVGAKTLYFFTGCLVWYALYKKTVHPYWYMPWLVMTGFFLAVMYLIAFAMTIVLFILLTFRPISVTWDIGPIVCILVYAYMWSYAWFVVIAHYKVMKLAG
jgi:hypothetical protein